MLPRTRRSRGLVVAVAAAVGIGSVAAVIATLGGGSSQSKDGQSPPVVVPTPSLPSLPPVTAEDAANWGGVGLSACPEDPHQAKLLAWSKALSLDAGPGWVSDNFDQTDLANLDDPSFWYDCWNDYLTTHPGTKIVYTVPMIIPDKGNTLERAAAGDYDSHFINLAKNLDLHGQSGVYLRLAWEFNGSFQQFGYAGDDGDVKTHAQWLRTWRRIVNIMRAQQASDKAPDTFKFIWNVNNGMNSLLDPTVVYPADTANDPPATCRSEQGAGSPACYDAAIAYVDMVSDDIYDVGFNGAASCKSKATALGYPIPARDTCTAQRRAAVINSLLNGHFGLRFWADFAARKNVPFAVSEWGLSRDATLPDGGGGGGDDAAFIEAMIRAFSATRAAYASYFNVPGSLNSVIDDGATPQALQRYRSLLSVGPR